MMFTLILPARQRAVNPKLLNLRGLPIAPIRVHHSGSSAAAAEVSSNSGFGS
jgi:hypothetical protein